MSRCCFVPMSKNSVLDGLRSNLLEFIQESMSEKEKALESIQSFDCHFKMVEDTFKSVKKTPIRIVYIQQKCQHV